MFGRYSARRIQRSTAYKVWSYLLVLTLVSSVFLMPQSSQAVAVPFVVAQTTEPEPEAVVPDIPAKQETVRRTAYSRLDSNPDGSYTATFGVRPLHWLDETTGEYKLFDNTLRTATTPGYSHENTANSYRASFEQAADVAAGKPVARIEAGDTALTMTAVGANPSASNIAENRIVYAGAYPDTDLLYTVDNERVKEEIVLKAAPAAVTSLAYTYDLNLKGLTATKRADNSVEFKDASGKAVFAMPAPFIVDSSGKPEVEYSDSVQVALADLGAGVLRLTLTPDLAWLTDPARVYPVTIDPTVEQVVYKGVGAQDVHLVECCPTQNTAGSAVVHVGKNSSGQRRDTLIRFPELNTLPQDSVVTVAYLKMYAEAGTNALPMEIHAITKDWTETDATWGSMPLDTTMGDSIYGSPNSTVPGWNNMWVTGLVRYWVKGTLGNRGFRIFSKGSASESVSFSSGDSTTAAQRPQLQVNYVPATRLGQDGMWTYTGQDHGGGNSSSVEVSTGNVVLHHDNGTFGGHTYNSQDPYGQTAYYDKAGAVYGEGWTFSENLRLYEAGNGAVVFKDGSGGSNRVYARNTVKDGVQQYFVPLYYALKLTKDVSTNPDLKKIWTLAPDSGGQIMYFDGGGKIRSVEDGTGNSSSYAYDTDPTDSTDPNYTEKLANPDGRLTSITDGAGRKTLFEYKELSGRLSKVTDIENRVSTYEYSSYGNLLKIHHGVTTNADGTTSALSTTSFGYSMGHHLLRVTNPRGHTSYINYGAQHPWDDSVKGPDGFIAEGKATGVSYSTEHVYRGSGALKLDVSGLTDTTTAYASRTFTTPTAWNAVQQELITYVWTPAGSQLQARLALRDAKDRVVHGPWFPTAAGTWTIIRLPDAHVDPAYKVKKVVVDFQAQAGTSSFTGAVWADHLMVRGVAESLTDSANATPNTTVKLSYDWEQIKRTCKDPNGCIGALTTVAQLNHDATYVDTKYIYDRFGLTTSLTDTLGKTTDVAYDDELRLVRTTAPNGDVSSLTYHPNTNEVHTSTAPTGETTRQGSNTATSGHTHYSIDPRNEERRKAGLEYVATITINDDKDNLLSEEVNRYAADTNLEQSPLPTPAGTLRKTSYTYDAKGNMTSMMDPNGNVTSYGYNTANDLVRIEAPAGVGETAPRVTTIARTADGSIRSVVPPKDQPTGQATSYEYDALGRISKTSYGVVNGVAAFSTVSEYDKNDNTLRVTDREGVSEYTYDENDRLKTESRTPNGGIKRTTTYNYHVNGALESQITYDNQTVSYEYDASGRLISQTDPNDRDASGTARSVTYAYDDDGRLAITTYPSGVSRRAFYGTASDLRTIKLQKSDAAGVVTVLQSFEYDHGYAADGTMAANYWGGFVRSVTELDGSVTTYGYDDLDRLVSAVRTGTNPYNQGYSYDANNNRITTNIGGSTTSASYDGANQMTAQGDTRYSYDRNGNLIAYGPSAAPSANTLSYDASDRWASGTVDGNSVAFGYDASGRRISRTVGPDTTQYWYDATGLAQETGASSATYLRGPGGALLSSTKGGYVANYGTDRLGTVTALTRTDGTLIGGYSYDPWGKPIVDSTGGWYNPFRYTGTYQDEATGLYQMGARYYQPDTARFTQMDPYPSSPFEGQRYSYTMGNPVNYTDPSGMRHVRPFSCSPTLHTPVQDFYFNGTAETYDRLRASASLACPTTGGVPEAISIQACIVLEINNGFDRYHCNKPKATLWSRKATSWQVYAYCGYKNWELYKTVSFVGVRTHGSWYRMDYSQMNWTPRWC